MSSRRALTRRCNGGNVPPYVFCGKAATTVVSAFSHGRDFRPLQWFACDDPDHHRHEDTKDIETEPLGEWLARHGLAEDASKSGSGSSPGKPDAGDG